MDFICTLNRDKIQNLIDEVVLKHFENENFMVKNELSKLAIVLLLNRKSEIKFFLDKLRKTPLHMGIEGGGEMESGLIKRFLYAHQQWVEENCEMERDDAEFFDFDIDVDSEEQQHLNYFDNKQKISAKEFMAKEQIEREIIDDLLDAIEIFDDILSEFSDSEITQEFLNEIVKLLSRFIVFEYITEFRDIGYSLETLRAKLYNFNTDYLNSEEKELLKNFIISIFEDIKKWIDEILIEQTAQDIHYLDASLLANILQIDILLQRSSNGDYK